MISVDAFDSLFNTPTTNINGFGEIDELRIGVVPAGLTMNVDTGIGTPGDLTVVGQVGGTTAVTFAQFNTGVATLASILGTLNIGDTGGVGETYLDDSAAGVAETYTVSALAAVPTFGGPGLTVDLASTAGTINVADDMDFFQLAAGTAADTVNVNATTENPAGDTAATFFGNAGDDTFNIAASALGAVAGNDFFGDAGNDQFNVNITAAGGISQTLNIEGDANDVGDRDEVEINDLPAGAARAVTITYPPTGAGDTTISGLNVAGAFTIGTTETIDYDGTGATDTVTVVGTVANNDLITVAPVSANRALVFNGGNPFDAAPEVFGTSLPGVAGGGTLPDLDLSNLTQATGLTIDEADANATTGDRLYVYGQSEVALIDPAASGRFINPFGFGNQEILNNVAVPISRDMITVNDTMTQVTANLGAGAALVRVNYDIIDFVQATPNVDAAVVLNAGEETTNPTTPPADADSDNITVTASPAYKFQINGNNPDPAAVVDGGTNVVPPSGDQLNLLGPFPIVNVFATKPAGGGEPVITLEFPTSGLLPVSYSSIEELGTITAATVNLIGDNNDPAVDQSDTFVVVGTDVDSGGGGDFDGANEFSLTINGNAVPLTFAGVLFLNVFGDDQNPAPGRASVGPSDIDTLDITPYADDTPLGWGIDVFFNEGNPSGTDGNEDLLIYNTTPVSEDIVIRPSGPDNGELVVTNGSFGTPIVDIDFGANTDIVIRDNDQSIDDTETLRLLGTNPDTPNASGNDSFLVNFDAAQTPASPLVTVTDSANGAVLYRLRGFQSPAGTNNGVGALGGITPGAGYTVSTVFPGVALTGGTGAGATANITTNAAGSVSAVTIVNVGSGYTVGDSLSATFGGGAGFSVPVASLAFATIASVDFDMLAGNDSMTFFTPTIGNTPAGVFTSGVDQVQVLGGAGDDSVNVDYTGGDPWTGGRLTYDGGVGADSLTFADGAGPQVALANVTYTPGPNPGDGRMEQTRGGVAGTGIVDFTNLEPTFDFTAAATVTVNADNADNAIDYFTDNGVGTLGAVMVGDSLYTPGVYLNVPLTGGTGTGARADIVVTDPDGAGPLTGAVSQVTLVNDGAGYTIGNMLSALPANIGGTGSGFMVGVTGHSATVSVDNQEVLVFANKTNLVINAQAGSDEINLNYQDSLNAGAAQTFAPAGLTGTITVNGGDPTASDTLIVNGANGARENLTLQPSAQGAGSVVETPVAVAAPLLGIPSVPYSGIEHLKFVQRIADGDALVLGGSFELLPPGGFATGNDTWEYSPGATPDAGTVNGTMDFASVTPTGVFTLPEITFSGVDTQGIGGLFINGDPTRQGGSDTVIYNGTDKNDIFNIVNDNVTLATDAFSGFGTAGAPIQLGAGQIAIAPPGGTSTTAQIVVNGLDGDDTINLTSGIPGIVVTTPIQYDFNGGNPSNGSDVLNLIDGALVAASAQTVTIIQDPTDPTQQDITGFVTSTIDVTGTELITYTGAVAAGGARDDTLVVDTGFGADDIRVDEQIAGVTARVTSQQMPDIDFTNVATFQLEANTNLAPPPLTSDLGAVTATFATLNLDPLTAYQFLGGSEDVLVIEGADTFPDVFTVTNPLAAGAGNVVVTDTTATFGTVVVSNLTLGPFAPGEVRLNTLAGDDVVIVDVGGGGFGGVDLIDTRIVYNGGSGGDVLNVVGTPATAVIDTVYTPGADSTSGRIDYGTVAVPVPPAPVPPGAADLSGTTLNGTMQIEFTGLQPVVDVVPAVNLIINANNADNAISYTAGPNVAALAANTGLVAIDNNETYEFANKGTLTINALGGSDEVSLNNPTTPTGLVGDVDGNAANGVQSILINGGDPTAGSDTAIVSGTTGGDAINFAPTTDDDAIVSGAGPVAIILATIESTVIDGQGGIDNLTYTSPAGLDLIDFTPGSTSREGSITGEIGLVGTTLMPLRYIDIFDGAAGPELTFADASVVPAPTDVLYVAGTNNDDVMTVSAAGLITTLDSQSSQVLPRIATPGVASLTLQGLNGDDIFNIAGNHPFPGLVASPGISIEGGNPDAGSDTTNLLGAAATVENVLIAPTVGNADSQTVTGLGAGLIQINGTELITYTGAVAARDDTLVVETGPATDNIRVDEQVAGVTARVTSRQMPDIDFTNVLTFQLEAPLAPPAVASDAGAVTATFKTLNLDPLTAYQFIGNSEDVLVIEGADTFPDLYSIINPIAGPAGGNVVVTDQFSGVVVSNLTTGPFAPGEVRFNTLAGDDTVVVDVGGGGFGGVDLIDTRIVYDGGTGGDVLQVIGNPVTAVINEVYTPGPDPSSGRIDYGTGLLLSPADVTGATLTGTMQIEFTGLQPVVDVVPAVNLIVNASNADNVISYTAGPNAAALAPATGLVAIDNNETMEFAGKTTLALIGLAGDDTINLENSSGVIPTGLTFIMVNGGLGSDTIDGSGNTTLTPLMLFGGNDDDTLTGGLGGDLLSGGIGNDTLIDSAGVDYFDGGNNGQIAPGFTAVAFPAIPVSLPIPGPVVDPINGTAGFDTVVVPGTPANDIIGVTQNAPIAVPGSGYPLAVINTAGGLVVPAPTVDVLSTVVAGANPILGLPSIEEVRIEAGLGNDEIVIAHADQYSDAVLGTPGNAPVPILGNGVAAQMVRFDVRGDAPNSSDRLTVQDLGVGDLVLLRQSVDERSGRVTVAPAVNLTTLPGFFGDIVYSGIENVDVTPVNPVTGATGTGPFGQVVVFDSDPFEFNDNLLVAGDIGDLEVVARSPNIDPGNNALLPVAAPAGNGDEDWYSFTPAQNGTFQINTLFTALPFADSATYPPPGPGAGRPGLPGNGVLASGVYTAVGGVAPIVVGSPLNDPAGVPIGSQLQFAGLEGVTYYLRVTGGGVIAAATPGGLPAAGTTSASAAINTYDVSVAQIDELGPQVTAVNITGAPAFNLFANKPANAPAGPTPPVIGLTISFRDLVSATQTGSSVIATLGALDPATALAPGNYELVGDHSGPIQITNVAFAIPPTPLTVAGALVAPASATIPLAANTFGGLGGAPALSPIPNFYVGQAVQFTGFGAAPAGQARTITGYTGAPNFIFTFDAPFTAAPTAGAVFSILPATGAPVVSNVTAAPTATTFIGNPASLPIPPNGNLAGQLLLFTGGALTGQAQVITGYNAVTRTFTVENPFTSIPVPGAGTTFTVLPIPVAAVNLTFAAPLPDDRFTLTVNDSIKDPAGNELDGESNADEPNGAPTFPSGDYSSGGDFVARFTVDSRPEVATWSQGSVYADINGNFVWDPEGQDNDAVNRDFTFKFGLQSDAFFNGNFAAGAGTATGSGFDKLGAYGAIAGTYGFALDTNDDGVAETFPTMAYQVNGIPVAGNFDAVLPGVPNARDEIGLFDGTFWYLDVNGSNSITNGAGGTPVERFANPAGMQNGIPFVGDFDGNGFDDLATFNNQTGGFQFIMMNAASYAAIFNAGAGGGPLPAPIAAPFVFFPGLGFAPPVAADQGFSGFGEKPLAGDMNLDGIDDIVLWVPGREGQLPKEAGEFYFLVSDGLPAVAPAVIAPAITFAPYSPAPLGNDLYAQFGDDFALPLLGNFDPPIEGSSNPGPTGSLTNQLNPLDTNGDGKVTALDALVVINALGRGDIDPNASPLRVVQALGGMHLDASGDGVISSLDALRVINGLVRLNQAGESEAPAAAASWAASADSVIAALDDDDDDLLLLLALDAELTRAN